MLVDPEGTHTRTVKSAHLDSNKAGGKNVFSALVMNIVDEDGHIMMRKKEWLIHLELLERNRC